MSAKGCRHSFILERKLVLRTKMGNKLSAGAKDGVIVA
jgi:hypothetical protein